MTPFIKLFAMQYACIFLFGVLFFLVMAGLESLHNPLLSRDDPDESGKRTQACIISAAIFFTLFVMLAFYIRRETIKERVIREEQERIDLERLQQGLEIEYI